MDEDVKNGTVWKLSRVGFFIVCHGLPIMSSHYTERLLEHTFSIAGLAVFSSVLCTFN